ncbi:MAG: hypothetical protein QXS98_07575 [Candidatus Nitrosocaldus sp.]
MARGIGFGWLIVVTAVSGIAAYMLIAQPTLIRSNTSSMLELLPLDKLVEHSKIIVVGEIVEQKPSVKDTVENADVQIAYTEYILKVERYLLNNSEYEEGDTLIFKNLGGKVGIEEFIVEDSPEFKVGDRVLLLLTDEWDDFLKGSWNVVGWRQGAYTIKDGIAYNQFYKERSMPEDELVKTIEEIIKKKSK